MLFQYPDTSGKIDDFSELVKKAHDVKVCQKSCRFRKCVRLGPQASQPVGEMIDNLLFRTLDLKKSGSNLGHDHC